MRGWRIAPIVMVLGATMLTACAETPEAKRARHERRGDKFFAQAKYREAVLEYQNLLRIDHKNTRAIERIGLSYHRLNDPQRAFPYLHKSWETTPDNAVVAVKLATIYLIAGKSDEARKLALSVLERDANNLEALQVLAGAARTEGQVKQATQRLQAARPALGEQSGFHTSLAELSLKARDADAAERALREAVERDPKSSAARLALASFYAGKGAKDLAEAEFKKAVEIDPVTNNARLRLAEFYVLTNRRDDGKAILKAIREGQTDYLPARRRLAELALIENKLDESLAVLDGIFKKSANDVDSHFIRGRILLIKDQLSDAIQSFQTVLRLEPKRVEARYFLALALRKINNVQQAKSELALAMETAPNFTEGALLLAQLNLDTGNTGPAIESMEKLIATHPGVIQAYVILGSAHLNKRNTAKAVEIFRKMEAAAPKDPRAPYLAGMALQFQGKRAEATREFERALAMAPTFVDPLGALVSQALTERQFDVALERVKKQIALEPKSAAFRHTLGLVHHVRKEPAEAEAAFLKALELDPGNLQSYVSLGRLYLDGQNEAQALARFEQALGIRPDDVVARMMSAQIYLRRGELAQAKAAYERILAANPRFAPAANNLAWILASDGNEKDRALRLAQVAKEAAPEDPYVSDTLGWILYQRGVYERAWNLLRDSAAKLMDNPEVQYHAGMAARKIGQTDTAREFLKRAVASAVEFPAKRDAQRVLSELQ